MAFHDHTENGITVLQSDLLCGSIRHGFSTRTGGVSPAPWDSLNLGVGRGDDLANVQENFRRLCGVLGLSHQRAVLSKQVHEDNIRLVTEADCGKGLHQRRRHDLPGEAHPAGGVLRRLRHYSAVRPGAGGHRSRPRRVAWGGQRSGRQDGAADAGDLRHGAGGSAGRHGTVHRGLLF